ncbi:MAG TPA: hypothetical protein VFT51_09760, partial [Bacillales bacterium]|nr:hypothetical protein [Bacillales bacterium]
ILSSEERLIETAAALHLLTEKEQSYSDEVVQVSFKALTDRWTAYEQKLKNFAAAAESKIHYSPFELSLLSGFQEMMKALDTAKDCLGDWLQRSERNRQFRIVLCHGKLSTNHFINDKLLNLEHTVLDSPVCDLAFLIRSSVMRGVSEAEDPYDWLQTYEERFPLRKEERILLAAYLICPEPIYRSVREYEDMTPGDSEEVSTEKLEKRILRCRELRGLAERLLDKE